MPFFASNFLPIDLFNKGKNLSENKEQYLSKVTSNQASKLDTPSVEKMKTEAKLKPEKTSEKTPKSLLKPLSKKESSLQNLCIQVTDEQGHPVIGASVSIRELNFRTQKTDNEGIVCFTQVPIKKG